MCSIFQLSLNNQGFTEELKASPTLQQFLFSDDNQIEILIEDTTLLQMNTYDLDLKE